jgi:DnaJ-class molecular chaperone
VQRNATKSEIVDQGDILKRQKSASPKGQNKRSEMINTKTKITLLEAIIGENSTLRPPKLKAYIER